ncbi:MAG: CotS family spore coat protein [Clostridiaceae bacterium]|jgi:CotS family spore coat protein|nr:CotS family spore coat protein [Bacillota bacterium]NLP08594.1 CotS family spore coat protein [Clostridiaceae bacterium]
MSPVTREPLEEVLKHYPLTVEDIRNESYKEKKGVWWVRTTSGMKVLKKVSSSEQTLRFILDAVRHLRNNGVLLPEVNMTSDGNEYVNIEGTCFVLTDAVNGKNPSYSSAEEMSLIASGLADFHRASAGFRPTEGTKPKYHLGTWPETYSDRLEDIRSYCDSLLAKSSLDAIDTIILKEFPYYYERGKKAIEGLKGNDYLNWSQEAEGKGSLCHQDFAAGNLLLTDRKELYVLDTDSITIDIAARDIRKLLNKVMKKSGKWNAEKAAGIFRDYQAVNPLTPSQWEVVRLDLLFPHLFLGAVSKYCYRRDKEWSYEKYMKRIREMAAFEKTAEPVLENFSRIIPV